MNAVDGLLTQLADQSSDAWCVVQNSPFRVLVSSRMLQRQLGLGGPHDAVSGESVQSQLEDRVREICESVTIHCQSGDCLSLSCPFGRYNHVQLTKIQMSSEQSGLLMFFREKAEVSPADEIAARIKRLSPRQSEIMVGLYAGETNRSMSIRMGISEKTVEKHRAKVMENMQARSSAELIRMITIAHISGTSLDLGANLPGLDDAD